MHASDQLVDWGVAKRVGATVSGDGPQIPGAHRARMVDEFTEILAEAEGLVTDLTGLSIDGPATRPWVMTRREWIGQNLRGFEGLLDPLADRVLRGADGPMAGVRRKVLATQLGGLLGYLARRVLGQYDLFLPPDDRELLYFIEPNVIGIERRFALRPREFRLWLALHEVTHRVQFDGVPWVRGYMMDLVREYLDSIDLDPRRLIETFRRAREEAQRSSAWRGLGFLFLLMTPEQRETFQKMQALMSLLEGHGNYAMNALSEDRIETAPRMRRVLRERRRSSGAGRAFQKAIGLDVKIRQYDAGERFVAEIVSTAGMETFNRVWDRPENLPLLDEVARPDAWIQRVASS